MKTLSKHSSRRAKKDDDNSKKRKKSHVKGFVAFTVLAVISLIIGLLSLGAAGTLLTFAVWSDGVQLDTSLLPTARALPTFLDRNGKIIPYESDSTVSVEEIPESVKTAFVALEDKRFYSHKGYDTVRMASAIINNLKAGKTVEGASTITQQLVKNTHLTSKRSIERKLKEIALAEKLEEKYSKDEILAMYLSVIYFGDGAYGIKDASKKYFDKTPDKLTVSEAATLAGIVKNPSRFSPSKNAESALGRRNLVLSVMEREGYLNSTECETAKAVPLTLANNEKDTDNLSDFYLERVIEEVTARLNITKNQLDNSGYTIFTNMDTDLQKYTAKSLTEKPFFENGSIDSSAIIMDNKSGGVLAHASSLPYTVYRQCGSVLKPIAVYAPALEENYVTLSTQITDEKTTFGDWTPSNVGNIYYGKTTPREAIKHSMNVAAVKIGEYVGAEKMASYAKSFGVGLADEDANLTLALGATKNGVTPMSIAAGYCTLARGGEYISPCYVSAVLDGDKKIYTSVPSVHRVIGEDTAYLLTDCLIDTVQDGTAKTLSTLPFKVASKTGTAGVSDYNTDAWNAGYTKEHTVVVWHGASSMSETGGGEATMHAKNLWQTLYEDKTAYPVFAKPLNVESVEIDTYSSYKTSTVVSAVQETPNKYRKKELYKANNKPSTENSLFLKATEHTFVTKSNGRGTVKITFPVEEIYTYTLKRSDIFGEKVILTLNGADYTKDFITKKYSHNDKAISLKYPVTYTLTISLNNEKVQNVVLLELQASTFVNYKI